MMLLLIELWALIQFLRLILNMMKFKMNYKRNSLKKSYAILAENSLSCLLNARTAIKSSARIAKLKCKRALHKTFVKTRTSLREWLKKMVRNSKDLQPQEEARESNGFRENPLHLAKIIRIDLTSIDSNKLTMSLLALIANVKETFSKKLTQL